MKKFILLYFVFLFSLFVIGCSDVTRDYIESDKIDNKHDETLDSSYFEAVVIEIYEDSVLVSPLEGSFESKSANKIVLSLKSVNIDFELAENQRIGILYMGGIAESYPAQINSVIQIELLNATENNADEKVEFNTVQEKWGITLETQNVTASGLTLVCHQLSNEGVCELTTGSYFSIQKLVDNEYIDVEYLPQEYDIAWTSEALIIFKDATTTWDINWEWLYGELSTGEYRIGKEIMNFKGPGDYETEMIYGYFVVK